MNSTYEFGVYLTHFCNVDLFRQGLYFFRVGVYNKEIDASAATADRESGGGDGEIKHYALPYRTMMGKQHDRDFLVRSQDRQQTMGHIDDVTLSYFSSVFRVQYQEQKVRLNEGCLFRLDMPYEPKQRVYVDVELVFCELHASDYKNKGFPTFEEFTIVDKTTLCMEDSSSGMQSLYPVSFSTSHFCLVHCMVHGELINFKFIPPPPQHKLIQKYVRLKQLNGRDISDLNHHNSGDQRLILDADDMPIPSSSSSSSSSPSKSKTKKAKTKAIKPVPVASPSPPEPQQQPQPQQPQQDETTNPTINVNLKQHKVEILHDDEDDLLCEPVAGRASFAEVLFYDRVDCVLTDDEWKTASEHHLFYVACLLHTYEKLQKTVHEYIDTFLDDANIHSIQHEFDELYPVPEIELDDTFTCTATPLKPHTNAKATSKLNGMTDWKYSHQIIAVKDRFSPAEKRTMTGRKVCHIVGEDVHKIAGQLFRVWHFFLSLIPYCKRLLTRKLLHEWEHSFVERWGACIFRETLTVRARLRVVSTSLSEHEMISRKVRSQSTLNQLEPPPLQDVVYMIDPKQQAVIFEQSYNLPDNRSAESIRLLDQIGTESGRRLADHELAMEQFSKSSVSPASTTTTASSLVSTTISAKHKKKLKATLARKPHHIVVHKKLKDKEKFYADVNGHVGDENDEVMSQMVDSLHIDKNDDKHQSNMSGQLHASISSMTSSTSTSNTVSDDFENLQLQQERRPPLIVRADVAVPVMDATEEDEEKKITDRDTHNVSSHSDGSGSGSGGGDTKRKKHRNGVYATANAKNNNSNSNSSSNSSSKRKRNKHSHPGLARTYSQKMEYFAEMDRETDHACVGKHLFVLVHGYQGNSWDMRMFRNHLLVKCPNDLFLMSEANEGEGQTEGDITEMGLRLAHEIVDFIEINIRAQKQKLCRLSFITHSLGGVIAREALSTSVMTPFVSQCYTFISLAVCHCGYLFGRSKALQAGFWVMRSWKKSLSLSQLSLTDDENPRKTYMYRLSQKASLSHFQNVLLVSSPEDRYTPYHSTRIEMHRKTVQDTKWGRIYNEMVRNLLRPLENVNLTRFDVSFVNRKMNLDSMIGRSAHICFLEQPLYIDMLIHVYKKYYVST